MAERILRQSDVVDRVKRSRTSLWRLERMGLFPRRRNIGGGNVGWLESEIDRYIKELPVASAEDSRRPTPKAGA